MFICSTAFIIDMLTLVLSPEEAISQACHGLFDMIEAGGPMDQ